MCVIINKAVILLNGSNYPYYLIIVCMVKKKVLAMPLVLARHKSQLFYPENLNTELF